MKLLIITQKINKDDPILGFFHGWIKEFSKHFDSIVGICLEKWDYDLPENVKVLSLGKEEENVQFFRKLRYIIKFWSYIWRERKNYDAVFVHMNQEYILLGGFLWKLLKKRVYMWRNHHSGSILTDISSFFCTKVFCTSRYSYTAKYKKTVLMPVGIDIDLFRRRPEVKRKPRSILFLGRIAPVKRPDLLIDALTELKKQNIQFTASFYGNALPADQKYFESLTKKVEDLNLSDRIFFHKGVSNEKAVEIYNQHEIFVNLSTSGMYDKTIFEAMACECLVLASNRNLSGYVSYPLTFDEGNTDNLVKKLNAVISLDDNKIEQFGRELRDFFVVSKHSLKRLGDELYSNIAP